MQFHHRVAPAGNAAPVASARSICGVPPYRRYVGEVEQGSEFAARNCGAGGGKDHDEKGEDGV